MRRLIGLIILMVAAVLLVSACGKKLPPPLGIQLGPGITLGALPTEDNHGGDAFAFTAQMTSGSGVTSWSWTFGGGAVPNTATGSGNTSSVDVILVNPSLTDDADYDGSFTATDANGTTNKAFSYTVGETLNRPPEILTFEATDGVLTVTATDPDPGDQLTFAFAVVSGDVTVSPASIGPTAVFTQTATVTASGLGTFPYTASVTVDDGKGGTDDATTDGTLEMTPPNPNMIWMTVDRSTVAVGGTVVMTVWAYNTANALRYLDSAMIEFDGFIVDTDNGKFNDATFNVGAVGGNWNAKDGIWASMTTGTFSDLPPATGLFGPYDATYFVEGVQVPAGRRYFAPNLSPTFVGETPSVIAAGATGALFNVILTAETAGTHEFHFVHEYTQTAGGAVLAGTMYSSDENTHYSFDDSQSLTITVE